MIKYVEKYDCYIDDDYVVYHSTEGSRHHCKGTPTCKLVQVNWVKSPNGYLYARPYYNGKHHSLYYHIIKAMAFVPNPENKPTVDHINRNRLDNSLDNLRWATRTEQRYNSSSSLFKKCKPPKPPKQPKCRAKQDQEAIQKRKREYKHEYYLKNKEAIKQYVHEHYLRNKEAKQQYNRDYYLKRKEAA